MTDTHTFHQQLSKPFQRTISFSQHVLTVSVTIRILKKKKSIPTIHNAMINTSAPKLLIAHGSTRQYEQPTYIRLSIKYKNAIYIYIYTRFLYIQESYIYKSPIYTRVLYIQESYIYKSPIYMSPIYTRVLYIQESYIYNSKNV